MEIFANKRATDKLKGTSHGAGFTQAELAEIEENCRDNIRRLERKQNLKNPTYQLLYDIAEFFESPVEEILGYEENVK